MNAMEWIKAGYKISTDKHLLQIDRIHTFLSTKAYWSIGIPKSVVENAIQNAICFGVYEDNSKMQIGFARIVTDEATFAWISDVYVEEEHRKKGLSKWLMECLMTHPSLKNLRRICLATKDAHTLYQRFGFEITTTPRYWMEIKDNDIYTKMQDLAAEPWEKDINNH